MYGQYDLVAIRTYFFLRFIFGVLPLSEVGGAGKVLELEFELGTPASTLYVGTLPTRLLAATFISILRGG